jgi:hypothetical protein
MRTPTVVLAAVLLAGAAAADEVYLKGGGRLSGRIVSRTETTIEVDVGAGRIGVPASSVLRIEEGRSPLQDYEERAGRLAPGDVDGWIALAQWAEGKGFGTQAREAYHHVLAASPDDPRANAALGNVKLNGKWASEEESYRARGYVQYEGEWVTAAERDAAERARSAEDERERDRREADRRVQEAEGRAAEAEARAKEAEAQQASEGIPLWYGWGAGPVSWPAGPVVRPPVTPPQRPLAPARPVPK